MRDCEQTKVPTTPDFRVSTCASARRPMRSLDSRPSALMIFLALLPALSLADTMGATAFAGAAVAMNDDEGHSKTATADDATGLESGNVEDVSDAGPPPPPHKCEDCKRA